MDKTVHLYPNLPYIVSKLNNITNLAVFSEVSNLQLPSFMDPPTEIKPYIIGTDGKQEITIKEFMTAINIHNVCCERYETKVLRMLKTGDQFYVNRVSVSK